MKGNITHFIEIPGSMVAGPKGEQRKSNQQQKCKQQPRLVSRQKINQSVHDDLKTSRRARHVTFLKLFPFL